MTKWKEEFDFEFKNHLRYEIDLGEPDGVKHFDPTEDIKEFISKVEKKAYKRGKGECPTVVVNYSGGEYNSSDFVYDSLESIMEYHEFLKENKLAIKSRIEEEIKYLNDILAIPRNTTSEQFEKIKGFFNKDGKSGKIFLNGEERELLKRLEKGVSVYKQVGMGEIISVLTFVISSSFNQNPTFRLGRGVIYRMLLILPDVLDKDSKKRIAVRLKEALEGVFVEKSTELGRYSHNKQEEDRIAGYIEGYNDFVERLNERLDNFISNDYE